MNKEISNLVKKNNLVVTELNQLLHNEGIEFNERFDIIFDIINSNYYQKSFQSSTTTNLK